MPHTPVKIFLKWLPLACLATFLAGLGYVAVQQSYRQSANDPQIQMSEDISAALASGAPVQALVSPVKVNMATVWPLLSPCLMRPVRWWLLRLSWMAKHQCRRLACWATPATMVRIG